MRERGFTESGYITIKDDTMITSNRYTNARERDIRNRILESYLWRPTRWNSVLEGFGERRLEAVQEETLDTAASRQ
jgi:hypothetical protein